MSKATSTSTTPDASSRLIDPISGNPKLDASSTKSRRVCGKKVSKKLKKTRKLRKNGNHKNGVLTKVKKNMLVSKKKKVQISNKISSLPSPDRLRIQIDKTDKENEMLRQRVRKITDSLSQIRSRQNCDIQNRLNVQADKLTVQCHHEKMKIKEYERKYDQVLRDVEKARKRYGGMQQESESEDLLDKQLRVLENRLESHLKKYNKLLSLNREKRSEIDKLKEERKVFDKIYRKIEKELHNKQKQLSRLIENSNHAFEERERINGDLKNIREGIRSEERVFDKKILIIDEILQSDVKVNSLLKLQERKKFQKTYKEKEITIEEQTNMKKSFIKGNWRLAEKRAKEIILKEKISRYYKIFREIEVKTNLKKEELIERLQESQEKYYQEFIFINKLNTEIEKLEKHNEELVNEIEKIEIDKKNDPEKRKLRKVQDNISQIQDTIFIFRENQIEVVSFLEIVLPHVQNLCKVLGIRPLIVSKNQGVGIVTRQMFMKIEEKCSNLMRVYFREQQKNRSSEKKPIVLCGSQLPKKGQLKFKIKPPSSLSPIVSDIQNSESPSNSMAEKSTDLPPLTREELEKSGIHFQK